MAMAVICDRCGQIYTPHGEKPRYGIFDREKQEFLSRCDTVLDICPDCEKKLEAWLAEKE